MRKTRTGAALAAMILTAVSALAVPAAHAGDPPVCGNNVVEVGEQCDGTAAAAPPSLGYRVVDYITIYEPTPPGPVNRYLNGFPIYWPDMQQIFERFDLRHLIDDLGVKEVWVWYGGLDPEYRVYDPAIHTPDKFRGRWESNMSSPVTGDISNSNRDTSDLPVYSHDYVVYGQNFRRSQAEAVHNHGHQLESILTYASQLQDGNPDLFWQKFVGNDGSNWAPGRCGDTHHPPNAVSDYDYLNMTLVESDIADWKPDGTGEHALVNADTWGSILYNWPGGLPAGAGQRINSQQRVESHWYLYWMQNMPGLDNGIRDGLNVMTNWWDFTGDWDGSIGAGKGLHEPYAAPAPSLSRTVAESPYALLAGLAPTARLGDTAGVARSVPDATTLLFLHFNDSLLGVSGETPVSATGLTFAPGVSGNAVRVDGSDVLAYGTAGEFLPATGTVEFWVQPSWDGTDGTTRVLFSVGSDLVLLKDGAGNLRFIVGLDDSEGNQAYNISDWAAGSWHHVAATWEIPGSMHVYVDGFERISHPAQAQDLIDPLPPTFGVGNSNGAEQANALIDELNISDVPRSADEIEQDILSSLTITNVEPVATFPTMYPTWKQKVVSLNTATTAGPLVLAPEVAQWATSDPAVASVDETGTTTALAPGEFDLIATVNGTSGSTPITVLAPVLPVVHEPISPYLATPAAGAVHDMPVAILRFLPTTDGVNLDVSWDPGFSALDPISLEDLKYDIDTFDRRVKFALTEGSRFRGYGTSACPGSCTARCSCAVYSEHCQEAPIDPGLCFVAPKTKLQIADLTGSTKDKISWQWSNGAAFDQTDLGTPLEDTTYNLCVYDKSATLPSLVASIGIAPSPSRWRSNEPGGLLYKDTTGARAGVKMAQIKTGSSGKTKVKVSAAGANLVLPGAAGASYFDQDPNVIVQLVNGVGTCWTSEFTPADTKTNEADAFKAQTK